METRTLLSGLIGFFIGGLLVSVAATTFERPMPKSSSEMSMTEMTASLQDKTGDGYDKAFIEHMINHHDSAVKMAELSAENAKHDEIKMLSDEIVRNQAAEIEQMKQWQKEWGYADEGSSSMDGEAHDSH